jgi:hypothetical protein
MLINSRKPVLDFRAAKGGCVDISIPTNRDYCDRHNQPDYRESNSLPHPDDGDCHLRGGDCTVPL